MKARKVVVVPAESSFQLENKINDVARGKTIISVSICWKEDGTYTAAVVLENKK